MSETMEELEIEVVKNIADRVGIHRLFEIVRDLRGEEYTDPLALEDEIKNLNKALNEAVLACEHNSHLVEEERLKHEIYRRDGEIAGLKYAIRYNGIDRVGVNKNELLFK